MVMKITHNVMHEVRPNFIPLNQNFWVILDLVTLNITTEPIEIE